MQGDARWGLPRRITLLGRTYLVRPLSRREYREITAAAANTVDLEDRIVELCCLEAPKDVPEAPVREDGRLDIDRCLAGIISSIAAAVLDMSGFGTSDAAAAWVRRAIEWTNTEEARFDSLICAMLHYTPMQIEELPGDEYMRCLALAHLIATAFHGISPDALQQYFTSGVMQQPSGASAPSDNWRPGRG